ncbi:hypothetical protein TNCV_1455461 [Trichonephila clavipes]|nr:hypothetical protein TNCV_1455461 [Trichonephila clavipes]
MQRLPETGRLGIVPTHMSCVVVTSDDTITARIENFLKILYGKLWPALLLNVGRNNINGREIINFNLHRNDSLRSGGRYPAQARFPGPKTCQGFALKRNRVPHGFWNARNLHSKIQSSKKYSRGRGKLSLEGAKPAVGFENYVRFIYVRRWRTPVGL